MLTREEAMEIQRMLNSGYSHSEIFPKFIEKTEREIQVGDIYRNNKGTIIEIIRIIDDYLVDTAEGEYLKSGKQDESYTCHLNLSKRYKLVEITDAD